MTRRTGLFAMLLGLPLVTALATAPPAFADDSPDVQRARDEFHAGVTLMTAGDFAGALAKFKDVARVKLNAQVAFNTADCEEHLGLLVAALGDFRIAAVKAQDGSAPDVASTVDGRIAAVEKRIPHLTIQRDEPTPNPAATVQVDGVAVSSAQIGKPMSVDPGKRVVAVMIDGKQVKAETITLDEGADRTIKIPIPAPRTGDGSTGPGGEPVEVKKGPSIPGIVVTSIGGASLVAGLVFVGLRQKAIGDLDTLCGGDNACPPSAKPTYDDGRLFTGVAEVTIPVGVAALTTGIVLIATGSRKTAAERASFDWTILPSAAGADGPGVSFAGRF